MEAAEALLAEAAEALLAEHVVLCPQVPTVIVMGTGTGKSVAKGRAGTGIGEKVGLDGTAETVTEEGKVGQGGKDTVKAGVGDPEMAQEGREMGGARVQDQMTETVIVAGTVIGAATLMCEARVGGTETEAGSAAEGERGMCGEGGEGRLEGDGTGAGERVGADMRRWSYGDCCCPHLHSTAPFKCNR